VKVFWASFVLGEAPSIDGREVQKKKFQVRCREEKKGTTLLRRGEKEISLPPMKRKEGGDKGISSGGKDRRFSGKNRPLKAPARRDFLMKRARYPHEDRAKLHPLAGRERRKSRQLG